jgi:hypothetical protein
VRRLDDPRWQLAAFGLVHVAIFAGLFRGIYSMPYSGTGLYFDYASSIVAGKVPYRDVFMEYPPLALVFFTLPRLFGASFRWYYVWYQAQVVVADLAVLAALYAVRDRGRPAWPLLAVYTGLLIAVGPIALQQYDMFPAALTAVAVACYAARRDVAAWVFLALGTTAKVYPALLVPVFLVLDDGPLAPRLRRAAIVFIATCAVVLLPLLMTSPTSLARMIAFHSERGIHLDSVYSTIAFAARSLGLTFVGTVVAFRSWNITGPAADILATIATPLLVLALASSYVFVYRHRGRLPHAARRNARVVATASALVVLAGLVTSKVLSPQYLIWPLPFLPLVTHPRRWLVWALFAAVGALSYYIYPLHYPDLLQHSSIAIGALAVRNLLLVTLTPIVAGSFRLARGASASAAEQSFDAEAGA